MRVDDARSRAAGRAAEEALIRVTDVSRPTSPRERTHPIDRGVSHPVRATLHQLANIYSRSIRGTYKCSPQRSDLRFRAMECRDSFYSVLFRSFWGFG